MSDPIFKLYEEFMWEMCVLSVKIKWNAEQTGI